MGTTIRFGLTKAVLGERFRARCAHLPQRTQDAWWERTDFGWVCTHDRCADTAGVNYKTARGARKGAEVHAAEHPGATVDEVA